MTPVNVRILLTSIGGHFTYDLVDALRHAPDFNAYIVGVDVNPHARAWHVDAFASVPHPDESEAAYVTCLLDTCARHGIDVVIPLSEGESRAVAGARQELLARNIQTSVSPADVVKRMTDKGAMFEHLERRGVHVGPWRYVNSSDDAERALSDLGYPSRPVVLKQRRGSGSRGIIIVDALAPRFTQLLPDRFCGRGAWHAVVDTLARMGGSLEGHLAMPYYGREVFDIDCLSRSGRALVVVSRLRQYTNPLSPVNEGCRITTHPDIERYVRSLTEAFGVDGACDFDIALADDGSPILLDASCRLSGSVGAAVVAGANVPAQLVRLLRQMPLDESAWAAPVQVRPVARFVRVGEGR